MIVSPRSDLAGAVKVVYCGATVNAGAPSLVTAGGTGDNTAVTGASIDRLGYDSAVVAIAHLSALGAGETLKLGVTLEDSADNSSWNAAVTLQAASTTVASSVGGGNVSGEEEFAVDLRGYARYVRFSFTPNLSRANTDTALVTCLAVLGGAESLPAA